MPLDGIVFDLDGTLTDTNRAHVSAWQQALREFGFNLPEERIAREIGKGGDKLVPALLGESIPESRGKELREAASRNFHRIADAGLEAYPGAEDLLVRLRDLNVRTAIATSSKRG